jgi:NADH:ubiquinone oxidoreductase subunit 3 (subunit A)
MFSLNKVDRVFLIIIIVAILVGVGIYFLIPILNRKQYQQMRENLAKREAAFKSNLHVDFSQVNNADAKEEQDKPQELNEPKEE